MSAKNGSALLSGRSRGRVLGITMAAVFACSAIFASAAGAHMGVKQTTLTLGDSLTFGYSQQLFNENLLVGDPASAFEHGFAQDYVAKESKASTRQLVDLGCPGETSNSLIGNGPLGAELEETSEAPCAYHEVDGLPLHVSYGPAGTSQLEAALGVLGQEAAAGTPVTTVTLDIGANDELHSIARGEAAARAAAEKAGEEAAYAYVVEAETPGTPAYEAAAQAGFEAYVAALEEGKSEEEAGAAGAAAAEAYVYSHAAAVGEAAGVKYGEEHGVAEVKKYLETHAEELFTHIVTNNLKIMGTLRGAGYTGKIIAVGGYDPYGNVFGTGELLASSLLLAETLNSEEEVYFAKAPYDACFANPAPKFNPKTHKEPQRLQEWTNMANTNVSNGQKDGPDIHPTPAGYEELTKIIKSDCGS